MTEPDEDHKMRPDSAPVKALRDLALALARGEFDRIKAGGDWWTPQRLKEIVVDEYVQFAREQGSEEDPYLLELSLEDLSENAYFIDFFGEAGRWRVDFDSQWSDGRDYRTVHADVAEEPSGVTVVFVDIEVM